MHRALAALLALSFTTVALAGCLTPAAPSEPLSPASVPTVGGSATVPQITAEGAEVVQHADAVELVWQGTAAAHPALVVPGVVTQGVPLVPVPSVRQEFPLPVEVTVLEATLTWQAQDAVLSVFVRNDAGRTQCRAFATADAPTEALCRWYMVGARDGPETYYADVISNIVNEPAGIPYELHLNLSVRPFPLLGPALAPEQRAPALSFFSTRVDEERRTGEPSLKLDDQGNVYVAAPTGRMQSLWRTKDGGATFEVVDIEAAAGPVGSTVWPTLGSGGGDAEVYVTPDGQELYFADLWACMSVAGSVDAGQSWTVNPMSCDLPLTDRQWLWALPGGHVWLAYNGVRGLTVLHSIDGGKTWLPPFGYIPEDNCARGNIVVNADGRAFVAGCNADGPGVAAADGTPLATSTWHNVAKRSGEPLAGFCYACAIFTVIDIDEAGNLYVVWSDPSEDGEGFDVWLSTSQDQAATWSAPVRVNKAATGNAILPWIAAREPGRVSVAWYQTAQGGSPSEVEAEWYVHMAESRNALDAAPAFDENVVGAQPVQFGPICLQGSGCTSARNLLDFLMVDIDPQGMAHLAFVDGGHGGSAGNSFIMYARQLGGAAPAAGAESPPAARATA
ncbi:MAG TPA: hypothetical protein VGR28_07490 [Candidatus Thermoplasmatota archaeon]|jgi:hypothetical protein|nr:hypothetical protein [Candidatus Thermoplasmatota archaeon]